MAHACTWEADAGSPYRLSFHFSARKIVPTYNLTKVLFFFLFSIVVEPACTQEFKLVRGHFSSTLSSGRLSLLPCDDRNIDSEG